LSWWESSC